MNWLIKWGIKKYALKALNGILADYGEHIERAFVKVDRGIGIAEAVLAFLKGLREKLADNRIDEGEIEAITAEAQELVAAITADKA